METTKIDDYQAITTKGVAQEKTSSPPVVASILAYWQSTYHHSSTVLIDNQSIGNGYLTTAECLVPAVCINSM
jgi:hypothetical protein